MAFLIVVVRMCVVGVMAYSVISGKVHIFMVMSGMLGWSWVLSDDW